VYRGSFGAINCTVHQHKRMDIQQQYRDAVRVLRLGGVVAVPTDTVFGLVAVARDDAAVARIYEIKGRDLAQPLPLFVASLDQAALIADFNDAAQRLAETYWPGALTVVVPLRPAFATVAAAGGGSIGLRAPADAFLREAAAQLGPLTGTTANLACGRGPCPTRQRCRPDRRCPSAGERAAIDCRRRY
jgi:L-threonylcarbamoyladenylate synthase